MLRTPDAPATSKQLWRLHQLTGQDTRDMNITMQQAHDRISELESGRIHNWEAIPSEWEVFLNTPRTHADIRLFFGDQGEGKSISTVACVIDDVYKYITHIVAPRKLKEDYIKANGKYFSKETGEEVTVNDATVGGEMIKANALSESEQLYLETPVSKGGMGIKYNHLKHIRVFSNDGLKSKIIVIPSDYIVISPMKVFANRSFYGIKYMPFDLTQFIQYINTPLFSNGWVILSESVLLNRKDVMSYVGRFMEWFGAENRKRHLRMAVDMQYRKMLAPTFHLYATTTVECSYDPDTTIVSLDVNDSSPVMQDVEYWSFPYRKFYKTDELMEIPQHRIDRAMETLDVK